MVYGILHLFGRAESVQTETLCLEMEEEVFHAGIVQTVSFSGHTGFYIVFF
ncbi:hypothetical protein PNH38_07100 [Anoxybacillus rupiensis]|uniref:Uncharacterized protein n=1 Tax=Anoxybacteroides rupiense TaxID=311460 RepID=A0ABT5W301_9BACL|nr:hypothetical protein [Anoxybacillus rupiensis]